MAEELLSRTLKCPHCHNKGPMKVLKIAHATQQFQEGEDDDWHRIEWEAGYVYWVLQCFSCSNVVFERQAVHTEIDPEGIEGPFDILYPQPIEQPAGLPQEIAKAYDAALAVRHIDSNAFATLLGRVLDLVCIDRKARGDKLFHRIKDLADRGELPGSVADVAHRLRDLRNIGAHANLGELSTDDIPLLESLCKAILVYIYTAPALVSAAQKRLKDIKHAKL